MEKGNRAVLDEIVDRFRTTVPRLLAQQLVTLSQ